VLYYGRTIPASRMITPVQYIKQLQSPTAKFIPAA